jgi:16S rRNA (guanine966-N2)-methyltransferase
MRIIGGSLGGRLLATPRDARTRPMLERTRGAVFNMIARELEGASVLDLYAGTGSLGIEALSRGAARAVFVERDRVSILCLEKNLLDLALEARSEIRRGSVDRVVGALEPSAYDVIFVDPPYREIETPAARARQMTALAELRGRVLSPGGVLVLHFPAGTLGSDAFEKLGGAHLRRYGRNAVAFLQRPTR